VLGERTSVDELKGETQPDLVLINDDDLAYTKIRLDERSARTLVDHIGELSDSLARALCWTASWDMTRDAELTAADWVSLVQSGHPKETDIGVQQAVVRQAVTALYLFTQKDRREAALSAFADYLLAQGKRAEPGSDRQLALVRAFVGIARSRDQVDTVAATLAGSGPFDGLTLDADLRWSLLHRLVAVGRASEEAIDEEFERDRTASGERQAAAVRASIPTIEAKERAWRLAVDTDELPNALLTSTITGFNVPDHAELNRAFIDRYFAMVEDVWKTRTNESAQALVIGLYPAFLVEQETIDRTEAHLVANDTPPALRRLLLEGADGIRRALHTHSSS
jgi:aminopeptidase N